MLRTLASRHILSFFYLGIYGLCLVILVGDFVSLFFIPEWSPKISLLLGILNVFAIGRLFLKSVRLKLAEWKLKRTGKLIILPPLHYEVKKQNRKKYAKRPLSIAVRWAMIATPLIVLSAGCWYAGAHNLLPFLYAQASKTACVAAQPPIRHVPNDVPNFSREDKNSSNPWQTRIIGQNDAQFSYVPNGYRSNHALVVSIKNYHDGIAMWYYPPKPAVVGNTYHFSDWYKSDTTTSLILMYVTGGTTHYQVIDKNIPASQEWHHYSMSFDIPGQEDTQPISAMHVPVSVMHVLNSAGSLMVDDVVFHPETDSFVRPLISITFDDGFRSQFKNALPLLCKYKVPATFYIISDNVIKGYGDYMLPNMVSTLIGDGMEVGDHTVDHKDLAKLDRNWVDWEIHQSKVDLERQFEIHIKDFASPYGSVNDKVLQQIHLWYQSHRSADVGLNTASEFDAYNIMCVTIDREEGTTLANIKRWIDQAIKTKTWLVLAFHQVDGPGEKYYENGDPYNATPEFLQQILSYVAAHPQTRPVTIDQGLSEVYQQV